jgi:hypothetical protein
MAGVRRKSERWRLGEKELRSLHGCRRRPSRPELANRAHTSAKQGIEDKNGVKKGSLNFSGPNKRLQFLLGHTKNLLFIIQ